MTLHLMAHHECVQVALSSGAVQWLIILGSIMASWLRFQLRRKR